MRRHCSNSARRGGSSSCNNSTWSGVAGARPRRGTIIGSRRQRRWRALDGRCRARTGTADTSDEIAVFGSEVHYRAKCLRAVSAARKLVLFLRTASRKEPARAPSSGAASTPDRASGHAARRAERHGGGRAVGFPAAAVAALAGPLDVAAPMGAEAQPSGVWSPSQHALAVFLQRTAGLLRAIESPADPRAPAQEHPPIAAAPARRATLRTERRADAVRPNAIEGTDVSDTRFGGLFYLLTPALELSIGDALWRACVSETGVFAPIAHALLGPEASDDPAPRLFAGARRDHGGRRGGTEIANAIAASIVALTRYRAIALPSLHLSDRRCERQLLVATASDGPFALFAWRALGDAREPRGALARWPANAPSWPTHSRRSIASVASERHAR